MSSSPALAKHLRSLSFAWAIIVCSGCASGNSEELTALEARVDSLQTSVQKVAVILRTNQIMEGTKGTAFLTPSDQGYSLLAFDLGNVTVSLEDVEAYANGSRAKLKFGNPTFATLTGITVDLTWGTVDEEGVPISSEAHAREVTFLQSFGSGSWTNVSIVLDGIPPSKLGYVRISGFEHSGVKLRL